MLEDDFISLGPNGRYVFICLDFPEKQFTADDLRQYVTHNLDKLTLEQCAWADATIALLRRLDAVHKS
jgi:hypothetical protein